MKFPVFDLHCDTALALLGDDLRGEGTLLRNSGHIDLERAGTLPGYAQCFACYTTIWDELPRGLKAEDVFEREMIVVLRELEQNQTRICQAFTPEEIEQNRAEGKMSAILTIEGPAGFGFDWGLLKDLYQLGFRITTLGWNEQNPLVGSHATGGGLTQRGQDFFLEAQRLGMLVDVSHVSDEGFWDMMELTQGPIVATHSNSRAVYPVSRNLTDEMFQAICACGGVAGINLFTGFLGEQADLDTVCSHIFHFLELDPDGTHVALGGDLDGCETLPSGFTGVDSYAALAQRLLERGLDETTVFNIFWKNALGVMHRCCM